MAYMYAQAGAALTHMMVGGWEAALHEVDEAVATATERSDAGTVSFCNAIGAQVCVEKRDWATALDYGNAAKETAPTVYFRGFAFGFTAPALCHTGAVDEGLAILEQIVPMAKAARHEMAWSFLAPRLADAYVTAGDYARAHQTLLEIHGAAARSGASLPRRRRTAPGEGGPGSGRRRGGGTVARAGDRDIASERLRERTRTRAGSTGPRRTAHG